MVRRLRRLWRWSRLAGWLALFGLLCALIWLHWRGLPAPATARLQAELRARGLDVHFTRLRLRWYRGLVAEDVVFEPAKTAPGLRFQAQEVALHLDFLALLRLKARVTGLGLQAGHLAWVEGGAPRPAPTLSVTNLRAELQFQTHDQWNLRWANARFLGADLTLSGVVTNASAFLAKAPPTPPRVQGPAPRWLELLRQVSLAPRSHLNLTFGGDARVPDSFQASLKLNTPGLDSPWAKGSNIVLSASLQPGSAAGRPFAADLSTDTVSSRWGQAGRGQATAKALLHSNRVELVSLAVRVDRPLTPWGQARNLSLNSSAVADTRPFAPTAASLRLETRQFRATWGQAEDLRLGMDLASDPTAPGGISARYTATTAGLRLSGLAATTASFAGLAQLSDSNLWPTSLSAQVTATNLSTPWGRADEAAVRATALLPAGETLAFNSTNLAKSLHRISAEGNTTLRRLSFTNGLAASTLALETTWQPPRLEVRRLSADLYEGQLEARASWNSLDRLAAFHLETDLDWHGLGALFPSDARPWLRDCRWTRPPRLTADGSLELPVWTVGQPFNLESLWPSLSGRGQIELGPTSLRQFSLSNLHSTLTLSNRLLTVPDLRLLRPEGRLSATASLAWPSQALQARVSSSLDPKPLLALVLPPKAREPLNLLELSSPPGLEAVLQANLSQWDQARLQASLHLTNAAFRGQTLQELHTSVTFSNQLLVFHEPVVIRPEGEAHGGEVSVDLRRQTLGLTNLEGSLDFMVVCRAVGPHVERVMQPYRFSVPPNVRVNGQIGLRANDRLDDIWFHATGGPFQWRDFRFQEVTGSVHWFGQMVLITNFTGRFHEGWVAGAALVDDAPREGESFSFHLLATNVNVASFLKDVSTRTNQLEGQLSGELVITDANTWTNQSWQGYGEVQLRDGLIWQVPLFSYLSPMLNKISTGLGSSRAREAFGAFVITNSVIGSTNLIIHTSGARLRLAGTVDFDQNLNGRVEAGLFRDTPGVGWLLSAVFWPVTKAFEYKFTGTLDHPKLEPLYIPKFLLLPFQSLRTLKELTKPDPSHPPAEFKKQSVNQ